MLPERRRQLVMRQAYAHLLPQPVPHAAPVRQLDAQAQQRAGQIAPLGGQRSALAAGRQEVLAQRVAHAESRSVLVRQLVEPDAGQPDVDPLGLGDPVSDFLVRTIVVKESGVGEVRQLIDKNLRVIRRMIFWLLPKKAEELLEWKVCLDVSALHLSYSYLEVIQ